MLQRVVDELKASVGLARKIVTSDLEHEIKQLRAELYVTRQVLHYLSTLGGPTYIENVNKLLSAAPVNEETTV